MIILFWIFGRGDWEESSINHSCLLETPSRGRGKIKLPPACRERNNSDSQRDQTYGVGLRLLQWILIALVWSPFLGRNASELCAGDRHTEHTKGRHLGCPAGPGSNLNKWCEMEGNYWELEVPVWETVLPFGCPWLLSEHVIRNDVFKPNDSASTDKATG